MQPMTESDIRRRLRMMDRDALETTVVRLAGLVPPETAESVLGEVSQSGGLSYLDGVHVRTMEILGRLEDTGYDFDDEDAGDLFYCDVLDALSEEFSKDIDAMVMEDDNVLALDTVFVIISALRLIQTEDDRVRLGFRFAADIIMDNMACGRLDDLFDPM